ncbi:MAG: histidine phosphatase family protein [Bacteroidetes Order II. Incertae sedis bacterium]|nr:histidine phosphatase family protein [Bacteroidetes Order II. bacterium]
MTTIYLTRHGETDLNRAGIVQGRGVNAPLNENGLLQAEALRERLSNVWLDAVYCSPLLRAVQTAETVVRSHPYLNPRKMTDLEEISWGICEGKQPDEALRKAFEEVRLQWQKGDFEAKISGGESALEVEKRAKRALMNIVSQHHGESVLIVTHGRFLRVLLASILSDYGLSRMEQIKHTNTSLNVLTFDGKRFRAELLHDTLHLKHITHLVHS